MSIQKIYCLRDRKANYLNRLDLFENDLVAVREYDLLIRSKGNLIKLSDYDILCLGDIDTTSDIPNINTVDCRLISIESVAKIIDNNIKEFNKYAKGL